MGNSACLVGVAGPVPKTPKQGFKVCVCGGAGGIGQPLCLLMALNPRVWELSVYDLTIAMVPAEGIGADLAHIERHCKVKAYSLETTQKPVDHLEECLKGCKLVLVPAGVPNKDRSKADLLKINANIAKSIVEACAKFCPEAVVGLIVNPLNSVVPAMARLYEKKCLDPQKICGITTLDTVRANKFVHEETGAKIETINVPVVCGHSGVSSSAAMSAVPLFSQDRVARKIPLDRQRVLIERFQGAGDEVLKAKKGKSGAFLSMAYAGSRFGSAVLAGFAGENSMDTAFVKSPGGPLEYFASQVTFGLKGVEKVHSIGKLADHEKLLLESAQKVVAEEIRDGLRYAEQTDLSLS